jgi:oxygen-dependent protoporphyrinogen oxidase
VSSDPRQAAGEVDPTDVVVVGGGVGGLIAARACALAGQRVILVEASPALGGTVGSHVVDGLRLDSGAESFATRRGTVAAYLGELGLADRIVQPNPDGAWVQLAERAIQLPRTGLLGIPAHPFDATAIATAIGRAGVARAKADLVLPAAIGARERTLGGLVRARMGDRVVDRLVAPIVSGVHSAHPDEVDADSVAPGLRAGLAEHGSLGRAVASMRAASPAGSAVSGISGGVHLLVDALVADLKRLGVDVRTSLAVEAVHRHRSHEGAAAYDDWHVELADGRGIDAAGVVLAIPASGLLRLFSGLAPRSVTDGWPEPSSVELVTLVVRAPELDAAPRGTGVLVAADAPGIRAKALTHATAKWPWLRELAGDRHVLRLSYGRAGGDDDTAGLPDDELTAIAVRDASALLGVDLAGRVTGSARVRWTNALPFAASGHRERVQAVRDEAAEHPGLEITGSAVAGTGLASVVADAVAAAERVLAR